MIRVAPYLVFAYVLAGLIGATSETPIVLGRYSYQAAALIVVCAGVYAAAAVGVAVSRRRPLSAIEAVALLALILLTFVVPGSNAVQRVPLVQYLLPAVRMLAAAALVARESARFRTAGRPNGPMLAAAMMLLVWASSDLVVAAATRRTPPHARASSTAFRTSYDLEAIPAGAVVLVGDSFVWGQGVAADETLGAQLEQRLAASGRRAPVYSLGVVGAGLTTYLDVAAAIPADRRARRIALVFYMNDMPPAPRMADTFRNQMITLGVGSPTLRIVGDLAGRSLTPTLDDYHARVAADYDASAPTFAGRWEALGAQLGEFADRARSRSAEPPLFVVLPLMVDFGAYPLSEAHGRLAALARTAGFEVIDLLPVFRAQLGDGRRHLAAAGDNHFDAFTHGVVAQSLAAIIDPSAQ